MRFITLLIVSITLLIFHTTASAGISKNSKISSNDALLIGGTQPAWIDVDGQNRGKNTLKLFVRDGDKDTFLATVEPGKGFNESVPKNKILVIENMSDDKNARVYWHISGYSKLANPRLNSSEQKN